MGIEQGITLEEALKLLAVAQVKIAEQEEELSEKELKLQAQTITIHEAEKELEKANLENERLREQLAIHLRHVSVPDQKNIMKHSHCCLTLKMKS